MRFFSQYNFLVVADWFGYVNFLRMYVCMGFVVCAHISKGNFSKGINPLGFFHSQGDSTWEK